MYGPARHSLTNRSWVPYIVVFAFLLIFSQEWPEENPFRPEDFFRADSLDDSSFYTVPRLVYHIDEPAVGASSLFQGCTCWKLRKQKCLIFVASVVSPF